MISIVAIDFGFQQGSVDVHPFGFLLCNTVLHSRLFWDVKHVSWHPLSTVYLNSLRSLTRNLEKMAFVPPYPFVPQPSLFTQKPDSKPQTPWSCLEMCIEHTMNPPSQGPSYAGFMNLYTAVHNYFLSLSASQNIDNTTNIGGVGSELLVLCSKEMSPRV